MQSKKKLIIVIVCIILVSILLGLMLVLNKPNKGFEGEYGGARVLNPGTDEWYLSKMYTEIHLGTEEAEKKFSQEELIALANNADTKYKEAKQGQTLDEYLVANNKTISDVNIVNYNYLNIDAKSERPEVLIEYKLPEEDIIHYFNVQDKKNNHNLDYWEFLNVSSDTVTELIEHLIHEESGRLITGGYEEFNSDTEVFTAIIEAREGEIPEGVDYEVRPLKYITLTYHKDILLRDLSNDIVEETSMLTVLIDLPLDFVLNE